MGNHAEVNPLVIAPTAQKSQQRKFMQAQWLENFERAGEIGKILLRIEQYVQSTVAQRIAITQREAGIIEICRQQRLPSRAAVDKYDRPLGPDRAVLEQGADQRDMGPRRA